MTKYIFTAEELAERDRRIARQARARARHDIADACASEQWALPLAVALYQTQPGPDPLPPTPHGPCTPQARAFDTWSDR